MPEFTESFHQLTASAISQLVAFLLLKYRANDPFSSHPTTMLIAVSSFMVYYLILIAQLLSPATSRFSAVAPHFSVCFGFAQVFPLATAVFPDRASPFLYAILGLLYAGQVLYMIGDLDELGDEGEATKLEICRRRVRRFFRNICGGSLAYFFGQQLPPTLPI